MKYIYTYIYIKIYKNVINIIMYNKYNIMYIINIMYNIICIINIMYNKNVCTMYLLYNI